MEKALESRLANIKALEKTLARRKEEIRQIEGQIASDKDNLRGSAEVWLLRKLGLETKYELVEQAYRHAIKEACKAENEKVASENWSNVYSIDVLLAELNKLLDDKFYGVSTYVGRAAFMLLNESIEQYVGTYFLDGDIEVYKDLRERIKSTLEKIMA